METTRTLVTFGSLYAPLFAPVARVAARTIARGLLALAAVSVLSVGLVAASAPHAEAATPVAVLQGTQVLAISNVQNAKANTESTIVQKYTGAQLVFLDDGTFVLTDSFGRQAVGTYQANGNIVSFQAHGQYTTATGGINSEVFGQIGQAADGTIIAQFTDVVGGYGAAVVNGGSYGYTNGRSADITLALAQAQ